MFRNKISYSIGLQGNPIYSDTKKGRIFVTGFWFRADFYALR